MWVAQALVQECAAMNQVQGCAQGYNGAAGDEGTHQPVLPVDLLLGAHLQVGQGHGHQGGLGAHQGWEAGLQATGQTRVQQFSCRSLAVTSITPPINGRWPHVEGQGYTDE
jgi:hypothetical protein